MIKEALQLGIVGETTVKLYFLKRGFEVYVGDDNTYFDFIIHNPKTNEIKTVEVKTTRSRSKDNKSWRVDIRKRRSVTLNFDSSKVDLLAVYIEPVDEIRIFKGKDIKQLTELRLTDNVGE